MLRYRVQWQRPHGQSRRDNGGVARSNATNIVWGGRTECYTSYRSQICRALEYPLCALLLFHCICCCLRLQGALIYRKCEPNRSDLFICINTLLTGQVTLFQCTSRAYFEVTKLATRHFAENAATLNCAQTNGCSDVHWPCWPAQVVHCYNGQTQWANCATARIYAFVVWLLQAPILYTGKV